MSRVMALDYGTKAMGVAVSDELRLTARPLTTLRRQKLSDAQVAAHVVELITEYEVALLLVGLPLNMDGTRGAAVAKVERFVAHLQAHADVPIQMPIQMIDERLTSREADARLREQGADARERKAKSDEYAALILLEDFLAGVA
ncbi:MAG: Holliday junction resolvase RuvX [Acidobacteria bacterium]|nr:Holliday junction resolvase RuvX [Acidobacteriota bacterium]